MNHMSRFESAGLAALEARLSGDLELLELPAKPWVPERMASGRRVLDVVIVGAGMCGLAAAAKLKLMGIENIIVVDAAEAGREGPWVTFARMETLRSPKTLAGPSLGLPSLTFRAWFTAQFGEMAWAALDKIPKDQWMDYLVWYRRVLDLPVRNGVRVADVRGAGEFVAVRCEGALADTLLARHLVLATGRSGLGGAQTPRFLEGVDRRFWAHSADPIDFDALAGRRVAVIGAGASAMDNAATALEAGAASVDMLIRRGEMPRINKLTGIGSPGVVHGLHRLPDAWKWRFLAYAADEQVPPPRASTLRVSRHPNARFLLGCAVERAVGAGDTLRLDTSLGPLHTDFVIAATGFRNDLSGRPEFCAIAPHVRTWGDGRQGRELGGPRSGFSDAPDLGPDFEFRERVPGDCPILRRIHCFNDAAMLTHGKVSGDIPAVSAGADRLARGVAAELLAADVETHFARLQSYDTPELLGDEWTDSALLLRGAGAP